MDDKTYRKLTLQCDEPPSSWVNLLHNKAPPAFKTLNRQKSFLNKIICCLCYEIAAKRDGHSLPFAGTETAPAVTMIYRIEKQKCITCQDVGIYHSSTVTTWCDIEYFVNFQTSAQHRHCGKSIIFFFQ